MTPLPLTLLVRGTWTVVDLLAEATVAAVRLREPRPASAPTAALPLTVAPGLPTVPAQSTGPAGRLPAGGALHLAS